jgi:co-chaperonin GroES (HSP10)
MVTMSNSVPGLESIIPLNLEPDEPSEVQLERMIPKPVGYHILVAMPKPEETFGASGLLKSAKTIQHDTILSMVGVVVDMGEQAYADKERFPAGPWCRQGDYVMFRMNSGTRFMVAGQEYRLLNDDSIEAVVEDPSGIRRVN